MPSPRLFQVLIAFALVFFLAVTPVSAQTFAWDGVCVANQNDPERNDVATFQGLECLIANVFIVFITLIGLAGFVMFLIGGFQWLASGGSSKTVEAARNTMMFAVVGLVVALSAFIILGLIADFTGVTIIKDFVIPTSAPQPTIYLPMPSLP